MRLHDAQRYQIELAQHRLDKQTRQKQLREYLNMQVSAKKQSSSSITQTEMQSDVELILKRVQEMKAREDIQRQLRLETLKRNNEFNL